MKQNEFRPLPDEFNLGYVPPPKKEEEEKKKKRKKKLRKVILSAAAVFLILPLTLKTGLFQNAQANITPANTETAGLSGNASDPAGTHEEPENSAEKEKMPDGTYLAGSTYVTLDKGRGWFFNGEYFIPLHYDMDNLSYQAAGSLPASETMSLDSTVYYVSAQGTIEMTVSGVRMFDPFSQETRTFARISPQQETRYIHRAFTKNLIEKDIAGTWTGQFVPEESYPMAYITEMTLSAAGGLSMTVANTENDDTAVYEGSWTLSGGILHTSFDLPLKYEIVMDDRTVECSFEQMPEGILIYKESGIFIYLNIFSSQLFVH